MPSSACQGGQSVPRPLSPPSGWKCIYNGGSYSGPCSIPADTTICQFNGVQAAGGAVSTGCCYPPDRCFLLPPTNGVLGGCSSPLTAGQTCSFTCLNGWTLDKPYTTCDQGISSPQQCLPPPCTLSSALPANAVGMGACAAYNGSLPSGQSCGLACAAGYQSISASCVNGVLSRRASCAESNCPFVPTPDHGTRGTCAVDTVDRPPGVSCTLACDTGYTLTPPGPTVCRFGVFTPKQICGASCTVQPPSQGSIGQCPSTLNSGQTCQMACSTAGYSLFGGSTSCNDGTLLPQSCQRMCPVAAPTNGAYNNCPTNLVSGASCSIACNDGYAVVGSSTSCSDGSLTSQICAPAPCPVAAPANGGLNGCPASLPSGSTCTFSCNTGYTLSYTATSCLAGVLTAQTCLTPEEIAAANAAKSASSSASGLAPGVQDFLISLASTLGGATVAFGGWYWKRSNDARKRAQRRALAAAIFKYLPMVDADDFDSPTGQEFTGAVDALAAAVLQAHGKFTHGVSIAHPRLSAMQQDVLGRVIADAARTAGLEINATTMPPVLASCCRCNRFKGALVSHFSDEHLQRAIVIALQATLSTETMQKAFDNLTIPTQASPAVEPISSEHVGIEMELVKDIPRSDQ